MTASSKSFGGTKAYKTGLINDSTINYLAKLHKIKVINYVQKFLPDLKLKLVVFIPRQHT